MQGHEDMGAEKSQVSCQKLTPPHFCLGLTLVHIAVGRKKRKKFFLKTDRQLSTADWDGKSLGCLFPIIEVSWALFRSGESYGHHA